VTIDELIIHCFTTDILCELQYSSSRLLLVYKHLLHYDPNRLLSVCYVLLVWSVPGDYVWFCVLRAYQPQYIFVC